MNASLLTKDRWLLSPFPENSDHKSAGSCLKKVLWRPECGHRSRSLLTINTAGENRSPAAQVWALSTQHWVDPRAHGWAAVCPLCLCVPSPGKRRWQLNRSAVKSRCMRAIVSGSSQDDLTTQPPADPRAAWVPDARAGKARGQPLQGAGSLMMTAVPRLLRTPLSAQGGRLRAEGHFSLSRGPSTLSSKRASSLTEKWKVN